MDDQTILAKSAKIYLSACGIWLILFQLILSISLFCPDLSDPDGLAGFDLCLCYSPYWFSLAFIAFAVCGLTLMCIAIVIRLRRKINNTGRSILNICAGFTCLAIGIGSLYWLNTEHFLPVMNRIRLIVIAGIFDSAFAAFVIKLSKRLRKS